ncbi:hypothetical protein [Paenibacillus anseongense]|uniref:hypothetical protein n=1 Tax=Paenibacillus anseongense TaxID=2682845 RepID=UPI002DBF0E43|nr:hypothetical protein [Paenibacillus anseongense]MEC0269082.1 hypothetical protein [Paenibacillus anseongense]
MSISYSFPIYSGVLEAQHYKQIGSALWLFLWCISSTTKDVEKDGVMWGIVLGNKPIKISKLESLFGVTDKTIRVWVKNLETHGYIKVTRAPYGLIFTVKNSKKFRSRTEENYRSEERERNNITDLYTDSSEENYRSNKDIIKFLIDRLINDLDDERLTSRCGVLTTVFVKEVHLDDTTVLKRVSEIEKCFNQRKGRLHSSAADWLPMNQVAKQKIPIEFILFGIDLAFARHEKTKQWPSDSIGNFAYCEKTIIGTWNRLKTEMKQLEVYYSEEFGQPTSNAKKQNQQQKQLSLLDQLIEEERRNEQSRSHGTIPTD